MTSMHDEHRKERHEQQKEKITSFACAVPDAPVPYNFAPMVPPTHTQGAGPPERRRRAEKSKLLLCQYCSGEHASFKAAGNSKKTKDRRQTSRGRGTTSQASANCLWTCQLLYLTLKASKSLGLRSRCSARWAIPLANCSHSSSSRSSACTVVGLLGWTREQRGMSSRTRF